MAVRQAKTERVQMRIDPAAKRVRKRAVTLSKKTERVQMRVDPAAKRVLERAAALSNTTVSGFVTSNALEAAARAIREHERIVLSDRDWELFFGALVDPPEPNAALREAFAAHERLIAKPPGA